MGCKGQYYVTTPIYYVNDRPHIGHVYTTTLADVLARYHRLTGETVFFLTGTDEHAAKVSDAAAERGLTAQQWADENAAVFESTFQRLGITHDDFIRTSQDRHKSRVSHYVRQLLASGDVYAGQYEGWYDAGQEEYVTENKAKEWQYKSPINGRPLIRKREKNYFFALSKYQAALLSHIEHENPSFIRPESRRNEVLARVRDGLNDVPISRTGTGGWGIAMPGDAEQTIYVWIDALFNYLTTVDDDERGRFWPANVHLIAKDILWFHAVIWPCILLALGRPLPDLVYAHSFWISEGMKMSKTLGNFIDLDRIDSYISEFSLDALRYFIVAEGPLGSTDADFAHGRFIDVYNSDLANTIGNCVSRVSNMTQRYFNGKLPSPDHGRKELGPLADALRSAVGQGQAQYRRHMDGLDLVDAAQDALGIVRAVDAYIEQTQPFKLAKDPAATADVGHVLYNCAEALRAASLLLWPIMPDKVASLWKRLGCNYATVLAHGATGDLDRWSTWGQLSAGAPIEQGPALFPRAT